MFISFRLPILLVDSELNSVVMPKVVPIVGVLGMLVGGIVGLLVAMTVGKAVVLPEN